MTATPTVMLSIKDAALATGIPSRTIRSWVEAGRLAAMPSPTGRLVDLVAVRVVAVETRHPASFTWQDGGNAAEDDGDATASWRQEDSNAAASATDLVAVIHDALAIVDRVTRENLELAGRVGFLQAEVLQLREQVKLLSTPTSEPASDPEPGDPVAVSTSQESAEPVNGQDSPSQATPRPWWKRWVRWLAEPV